MRQARNPSPVNDFQREILGFAADTVINEDNEIQAIWHVILRGPVLLPRNTRFRVGNLTGVYSLLVERGFFTRTVDPAVGRRPSSYRFSFTALGRTALANLRSDPEMEEIYQHLRPVVAHPEEE